MRFTTTGLGVLCCGPQASGASFTSKLILLVVIERKLILLIVVRGTVVITLHKTQLARLMKGKNIRPGSQIISLHRLLQRFSHGRRKGGRGAPALLDFKIIAKKVVFSISRGKKRISPLLAPL